jgi:hypothetical protein
LIAARYEEEHPLFNGRPWIIPQSENAIEPREGSQKGTNAVEKHNSLRVCDVALEK